MPGEPGSLESPFPFRSIDRGEISGCLAAAVGGELAGEELRARMETLVDRDLDTALTMVGESLEHLAHGSPKWLCESARMLVVIAERCDPEIGPHGRIIELAGRAMQAARFHDKEAKELGITAAATVLSRRRQLDS